MATDERSDLEQRLEVEALSCWGQGWTTTPPLLREAAETIGELRRALGLVAFMSYGFSESCTCSDCVAHRAARDALARLKGGPGGADVRTE